MPKLWDETIESHRAAVRDATLAATAKLVAAHGISSVTMSQIASETGIGRATLYKYFPDVNAILLAWHEQQVSSHLAELTRVSQETRGGAIHRLSAVLSAYAHMSSHGDGSDLAAVLHRGDHVARADAELHEFVAKLVREAAEAGSVRRDVPADELAAYCLHAVGASASLASKAAIGRLVTVTIAGLQA